MKAASCVRENGRNRPINSIVIHINRQTIRDSTNHDIVQVSEIIVHPEFTEDYLDSDLAVIKFLLNSNQELVTPICLKSEIDVSNSQGILVGFDTTQFSEHLETVQQIDIRVTSSRQCRNNDMYLKKYLSEFTFCGEFMNGLKKKKMDLLLR